MRDKRRCRILDFLSNPSWSLEWEISDMDSRVHATKASKLPFMSRVLPLHMPLHTHPAHPASPALLSCLLAILNLALF